MCDNKYLKSRKRLTTQLKIGERNVCFADAFRRYSMEYHTQVEMYANNNWHSVPDTHGSSSQQLKKWVIASHYGKLLRMQVDVVLTYRILDTMVPADLVLRQ